MHPITQELLAYLDTQRGVLRRAVDGVAPQQRERVPKDGQWSVAGVIEHLALVETRIGERLAAKIEEARAAGIGREHHTGPILPTLGIEHLLDRSVRVTAADAVQPAGMRHDEAWQKLESAGAHIRSTLRNADGLALGTIEMPHPRFGPKSLYYFFAFIGAHEARHAAQIDETGETLDVHC
jgi:hypothetical protein